MDLHPRRETPYGGQTGPQSSKSHVSISDEDLSLTIRLSSKGTAAGITGWRYEHLKALLSNDCTHQLTCMVSFARKILNADILPEVQEILRIGNLFGLAKPNGGTRPIAVTDVLRRWVTKGIALTYKERWAEALGPLQYAVGTQAGNEKLIRAVESFLEGIGEDFCLGGLDSANAFNSCDREWFMSELQQDFPELVPFFDIWYSGEAELRFLWKMVPLEQY